MSAGEPEGVELKSAVDGGGSAAPRPSASRIVTRHAGRTAVGLVREHNEDNFVVANLGTGQLRPRDEVSEDEVGERGLVFVVCDGMGGAAAGEVASQMAVDILVEAMRRGGAPRDRDVLARRLVSSVEEAGRRIFEAAQKERSRRGMGTTSTVAVLVDKVLFLAEVGDSRAYLLRRGQLKQLTKDQSLVNQLIEAGHLTEEEAESFEHSNIILQALGTSETVQVDLTFVELRRGDRLMMCSDGLSGLVHADVLRSTLNDVKDVAECGKKLIEYAEAGGGHDNITVVIVDFDGEGLVDATESDSFGYVQYPLPPDQDEQPTLSEIDSGAVDAADNKRPSLRVSRRPEAGPGSMSFPPEGDDEGESLVPKPQDDTRANALWVSAGVVALMLAVFVWITVKPRATREDEAASDAPSASVAPVEKTAPLPPEVQEVEVNVHTDVESGTLLVNGEAKGSLSVSQSRSLKLRPGAYRFEAQSEGNPVAVTVVTVRADADMPMDVFLQLPKGAADHAPHAGTGAEVAAVAPHAPVLPPTTPSPTPAVKRSPRPSPRAPEGATSDGSSAAAMEQAASEQTLAAKPPTPKPRAPTPLLGEAPAPQPASAAVPGTAPAPRKQTVPASSDTAAAALPVEGTPGAPAPDARPKPSVPPKAPKPVLSAAAPASPEPPPTQKPQSIPDNPF
jgi:protein phosphatase